MKSIKAILIMSTWTIFALIILYLFDAHINYRQIQWSIGIALALLIVHMVNMVIYFNITGKKPNDISHLEPNLLDDFDVLTNLYDKKFKRDAKFDRKNFINTQYVLFQLLRRHKYMCKKQDFNKLCMGKPAVEIQ